MSSISYTLHIVPAMHCHLPKLSQSTGSHTLNMKAPDAPRTAFHRWSSQIFGVVCAGSVVFENALIVQVGLRPIFAFPQYPI